MAGTLDRVSRKILGAQVLGRQRSHIRREHPDLIVGDAPAPRRHSIGPAFVDGFEHFSGRSAKMPPPVLEAGPHRAGPFGAVTIQTIVRDEELRAGTDRLLVAFVRIPDSNRLDAERKSGRKILFVLDELQTVTRNEVVTAVAWCARYSGGRGDRSGIGALGSTVSTRAGSRDGANDCEGENLSTASPNQTLAHPGQSAVASSQ
jgi:hypothetical protein